MIITLSPVRRDETLAISRIGDVLTINGETFDFSQLAEGDQLPADAIDSAWFAGQVTRSGGEIALTLILPLPRDYSPAQAFPEPLLITTDGPIALPAALPGPVDEELAP